MATHVSMEGALLALVSLLAYTAFILMLQNTAFAQASAARGAVEFIAVANVMPAFAAFYGAIDILKHRRKEN